MFLGSFLPPETHTQTKKKEKKKKTQPTNSALEVRPPIKNRAFFFFFFLSPCGYYCHFGKYFIFKPPQIWVWVKFCFCFCLFVFAHIQSHFIFQKNFQPSPSSGSLIYDLSLSLQLPGGYSHMYTLKTTGSKFDHKRVIFDPTSWVNYAPTKKGSFLTPVL